MTKDEELEQLCQENAALREQVAFKNPDEHTVLPRQF
jgi:hypothetical protein